jgi:hypothetical protein
MAYQLEVRVLKPVDVKASEVMTLTEAAARLGLSKSALGDLMNRGVLRRLVDGSEPNPMKANRVYMADVENELKRRRLRRADGRLKIKRGRPVGT